MKRLGMVSVLVLTIAAGFALTLGDAGAESGEGRRKVYWQKRYTMILSRKATAETRVEDSQRVIRKLRQRDRNKGEDRIASETELAGAEEELASVEKLLEEFPETARQAGVPPGWLRQVEALLESES